MEDFRDKYGGKPMFNDENMDLMKLFESADVGDVDALLQCVSYILAKRLAA